MSKIKKLADLVPDDHNANRGTPRGSKMINRSISENGFGRPILLDKAGRIIGGNKTIQEAADVFGIDAPVRVVETNGQEIIAHQRTDLDLSDPDPNSPARKLAYTDNLASHFSFQLDPDIVMADIEASFNFEAIDISLPDLGGMLEGAARELLGPTQPANDPNAEWVGMPEFETEDLQGIILKVHFANEEDKQDFFKKIGQKGTDKTISIWYPERPENIKNQLGHGLAWTDES